MQRVISITKLFKTRGAMVNTPGFKTIYISQSLFLHGNS